MKTPSAPTFLTKADRKLTAAVSAAICSVVELSTPQQAAHRVVDHARDRDGAADHQHRGDDDDDGVGETLERLLRGHHAGENRRRQRERRDQVVAQPVGDEQDEHPGNDRQGFDLGQGQADGS